MRTPFILLVVCFSLCVTWSCAPPWYGEGCNYDVAVLRFRDSTSFQYFPIADLGYTEIREIQRGQVIDQSTWSEVEELDFRGIDPATDLAFPLDPEREQSIFVLSHPNGNDTLIFRYTSELTYQGSTGCGYNFLLSNGSYSFQGSPFQQMPERVHPRILGEVEVLR